MVKGAAKIYQYADGSLSQKCSGMSIANGITWSADNRKLFVVDTMERTIHSFDFDALSGEICLYSV